MAYHLAVVPQAVRGGTGEGDSGEKARKATGARRTTEPSKEKTQHITTPLAYPQAGDKKMTLLPQRHPKK
jgi:hypothetical protein